MKSESILGITSTTIITSMFVIFVLTVQPEQIDNSQGLRYFKITEITESVEPLGIDVTFYDLGTAELEIDWHDYDVGKLAEFCEIRWRNGIEIMNTCESKIVERDDLEIGNYYMEMERVK